MHGLGWPLDGVLRCLFWHQPGRLQHQMRARRDPQAQGLLAGEAQTRQMIIAVPHVASCPKHHHPEQCAWLAGGQGAAVICSKFEPQTLLSHGCEGSRGCVSVCSRHGSMLRVLAQAAGSACDFACAQRTGILAKSCNLHWAYAMACLCESLSLHAGPQRACDKPARQRVWDAALVGCPGRQHACLGHAQQARSACCEATPGQSLPALQGCPEKFSLNCLAA